MTNEEIVIVPLEAVDVGALKLVASGDELRLAYRGDTVQVTHIRTRRRLGQVSAREVVDYFRKGGEVTARFEPTTAGPMVYTVLPL